MSQLLAGCFILHFDPIYVVVIFGFSVCAMLTTKCKVSQDQTGIRARPLEGSTTGRRQRLSKESSQTLRPRFAVRAPFVAVPPAAFTKFASLWLPTRLCILCHSAKNSLSLVSWRQRNLATPDFPLHCGGVSNRLEEGAACFSMCSLQCPDPQA